jgi:hypothetical protein
MHRGDNNILAYFTLVGAFVAKPLLDAGPVGLGQFSPTKASQFNQLFFCVLLAYPVSRLQTTPQIIYPHMVCNSKFNLQPRQL